MKEDIEITPLDIQQHQFSVRFRGFDIQEVDEFLEQIANTLEALYDENERISEENEALKQEQRELEIREEGLKHSTSSAEKMVEQMTETARKSAELIIAEAEAKAEKIIGKAHSRLAQLREDILQLKSQRIQMEAQLGSIIEAHYKLLKMGKTQMQTRDEDFDKTRHPQQAEKTSS